MKKSRLKRYIHMSKALLMAALLSTNGMADPLREKPPVPPAPLVARAQRVDNRWLELILPEIPYDESTVSETKRYRVTSSEDPLFSAGVEPILVNHRHWPENAWYRDSTNERADIASINVVYRIFLQLPIDLSELKHYQVTVDPAVAKAGTLDLDTQRPNDAIHVNQVGYRPADHKVGYLSVWTGQGSVEFKDGGPFSVVEALSGKTVFTGKIHLDILAKDEPWSYSNVYSMDFSAFEKDGDFQLHVPGAGRSFPFRIAPEIFTAVAYTMVRGMTLQRDGDAGLTAAVTHWWRPPAHLDDAIDERTGKHVDLAGGHMDAGDRGKYPRDSADTIMALASAIQLFPAQVEALGETLQIRESHNGIPDLIDEVLYEADWLSKAVLNTSADGALPLYLRPDGHGYEIGAPLEGRAGRVFFNKFAGPTRGETLFSAGALAMAANTPLMQKYAPARCKIYREAAEKAFAGFIAHNDDDAFWKESKNEPPGTVQRWSAEMLVAAANLLELTGDVKYLAWTRSQLSPGLMAAKKSGWALGPYLVAWFTLAQMKSPLLEQELKNGARAALIEWADSTTVHDRRRFATPFGAPLPWPVYYRVGWYFTGNANAWPVMLAYGVTGDGKYRDQLVRDWNWLLGTNPLSRSFVSGLGDPQHRPRWLVHEIAQVEWARYRSGDLTAWSEPPPGLLSADIQNGNHSWFLKNDHNKPRRDEKYPKQDLTPVLYRYHDSWTVENEMTIERLARTIASVIPLIALPGDPKQELKK